ncbi:DNA cytosine methyltransferase [Streptomyces sp. NBC_00878]|uniref:DNA cytosine methyltransferase n=1 Tax=Streptomyces sp. NBC_00878 TaxID=2975854 RepID=UPI002258BEB7|nr:DNA cytosine methyltransferase [Streptomyces sp. NBC_00878]MCX4911905.1 DNA cytosine methyltransferase [Streptomyces sp. NBC_00878]
MSRRTMQQARTATHRPATKRRRFRHDTLTAVDLFTGFGGFTLAAEIAGFTAISAANHNPYKVEVHEANHPHVEHWIADLVDREASDYHSARDLPAADLLLAGVSCVNHSQANTIKAYEQGGTLFDLDDPDYEARVTKSERDRATANCVLHYAAQHHPRLILIECTTELTSWGPALPNRPKIGDGTTYQWWLKQFDLLNYDHKILYLNSQFFGVPQSRDRLFIAFWDKSLPAPNLEHRPVSRCRHCDKDVEAVWTWKTGVPDSGSVRYGKQYNYRCPSCRREVVPPMTPSLAALDLTDLGIRIGDKPVRKHKDGSTGPLAAATMARAERCRQRFADFPAVLMPAKAVHGSEKHPWQPMATQTSQQETSILSTGAIMAAAGNTFERPGSNCRSRGFDEPLWVQPATNTTGLITPPFALAVDNYQGSPRGVGEPLPTQVGSETLAVVSSGVVPFRKNTVPTMHAEAMPAFTADQIPGLLTAAGTINHSAIESMLAAEWRAALAELPLEDCYFRMMREYEIGRGCGFDVDFGDYTGTFTVWGSARNQVDGFGNAVSPQVGAWIGARLRAVIHTPQDSGLTTAA